VQLAEAGEHQLAKNERKEHRHDEENYERKQHEHDYRS
jgi:hypothetical protein